MKDLFKMILRMISGEDLRINLRIDLRMNLRMSPV